MIDDIDLNKAAIIRRCLKRISEEYRGNPSRLDDFTIQDSIVLNLLRACEAAIDLAMHRVAQGRFGIPQTSRDSFQLLAQNGILSQASATAMKHMVGLPRLLELVDGIDETGKFLPKAEFVIVSGCGLNPFVNEGQR